MRYFLVFGVSVLMSISVPVGYADEREYDDEIVVLSQRVERTVLDVPSNVTVIDEDDISDIRAEHIGDLIKITPNAFLQEIPGDYSYFQIRGLPRNLEQSNLPVYVDGVPYTSLYGLNVSLLDVERVELIRGPQGNLYGSNARDGIISITTRQPGDKPDWGGQVSIGNKNYRNIKLSGTTPVLEDQLFASLAVNRISRDGFVENTTLNQDIDNVDEYSLRGSLSWLLDNDLTTRLTLESVNKNNGAYTYVSGTPALDRGDSLRVGMDVDNEMDQSIRSASLSVDWQLSSNWMLSSVTGVRKVDTFARFDADLSELAYGYYDTWLNEKDVFQEIRFTSDPDKSDIDWLFGLSYFNNRDDNRNEYPVLVYSIDADMERTSWNGYGNATWDFAPDWSLEVGLRYTKENLDIDSTFNNPSVPLPAAVTSGDSSTGYSKWLPKSALNWQFSKNQSAYVSYGEGLLSGGGTWLKENTDATAMRLGTPVMYKPEISSNIEVGYKAWLPESSTSFSLSVFQMDVEDYQHFYPDALMQTRVTSIDRVRSQGVEASVARRLLDSLEGMFSFGYNEATVEQIDGVSGATALTSIEQGDRIPGAPKYNANLQLTHATDLSSTTTMRTTLSTNFFGESAFDNGDTLRQASYSLFDLNTQLIYRDQWFARLWVKNLADERYQIYRVSYGTSDIASYGQPRTVGIDFGRTY